MKATRLGFAITLEALPWAGHPPEARLKRALKHLLRAAGLRCTSNRPLQNDQSDNQPVGVRPVQATPQL